MKKVTKLFLVLAALGVAAAAYAAVDCPVDGKSMYFTGNVQSEMGKLLKEYKCANGHTAWR